jgi:hypothetical protein
MKAIAYFAAMLAIVVSGCSGDGPVVMTSLASAPTECTSSDPHWTELPDSDVTRSQAARNYQSNKEAFKSMRSNRAICRAGLKAAMRK